MVATMRGAAGFDVSMTDSVSCPASCGTDLPSAANVIFSSLPTIIS